MTTEFTSRLRNELERARFAGAAQADLDRVFELDFEGDRPRMLIVELMPPGNVIVTDKDGKVVLAQEEVRSRARRVVAGENYRPPPQSRTSPAAVTPDAVRQMLKQEKTAGGAIGKHLALPRKYVSEVLARLGLSDGSPSSSLEGREAEIVDIIKEMLRDAMESPRPCVAASPGGDEIFIMEPTGLEIKETASSLSQLCDKLLLEEATAASSPTVPEADRRKELEVTTSRLKSEALSMLSEASAMRNAAERARSSTIEESLAILKKSGTKTAREPKSPSAVASVLFDQAKELERRSEDATAAASRLEKQLARLQPRGAPRTTLLRKRKPDWYEKFRWFYTSEGKLAVGGRDAQSNTLLLKRHLDPDDVVYHADLFGSPFFVLKEGRVQSEVELVEMSQATVSFSSGWKTGLGAADAYWVNKDQVSSTAESGEYLVKGSFVIRGKKNFVRHAMLQVAVGVDDAGRVVAGPESAVARACVKYVVLAPQREKSSETAKKVQKALAVAEGGMAPPPLDEVLRALPTGGGKIVRAKSRSDAQG